jgi:hypothetical protein
LPITLIQHHGRLDRAILFRDTKSAPSIAASGRA